MTEYAFLCGMTGCFEQYLCPAAARRFDFQVRIGKGVFEMPGMKRHMAYYQATQENLKAYTELEAALDDVGKEHLTAHECAWEERVNYAAISSYYCGYRAALSVIAQVAPLESFGMMDKLLHTEYELGFTEPLLLRERRKKQ